MEDKITDRSIVMVAKEQVFADLSGEAAILNLKSGIYYAAIAKFTITRNRVETLKYGDRESQAGNRGISIVLFLTQNRPGAEAISCRGNL